MKKIDLDNEREWRQFMVDEMRLVREKQDIHSVQIAEVKSDVKGLRGKVAGISSFIGACVGFILNSIMGHK